MDNDIQIKVKKDALKDDMEFELISQKETIRDRIHLNHTFIKDVLKNIQNAYGKHSKLSDLKQAGGMIYKQIFPDRIKEYLKKTSVSEIQFLIEKNLYWIPFELSYDGINFLFNAYPVARHTPSSQGTDAMVSLSYPLKVGIMADPSGDLPSALNEGEKLLKKLSHHKGQFIVEIIAGQRVTEKRFAEFYQEHDIIHFAGHVEKKPALGFRLADTTLTAEEVAGYNRHPFLLFVNGCNSIKLMDTDLVSKVSNFLGTFSEIPDSSSLDLALDLYLYIAEGTDIAQSLYLIRKEIFKKHGGRDLLWASYVYHGNLKTRIAQSELLENVPGFEAFREALQFYRHHEYDKAIESSDKAENDGYHKDIIYTLKGMILFQKRDDQKAIIMLKRAISENPRNGKAHFWLGKAYKRGGYGKDMERHFLKVFDSHYDPLTAALLFKEKGVDKLISKKIYGKNIEALIKEARISLGQNYNLDNQLGLALLLSMAGETGSAIENFARVIEQDPDYLDAHYFLVDEYMKNEYFDEAMAELEALRKVDKKNIELYNKLGRLYYEKGRFKDCITVMEDGKKQAMPDAFYFFNLGNACASDENYKKALEYYRTAVKIKPDLGEVYVNMAMIYQKQNKNEPAANLYKKALHFDPKNCRALNNYGILLGEETMYPQARKYLEKAALLACEIDPEKCEKPFINLDVLSQRQIMSMRSDSKKSIVREVLIIAGILLVVLLWIFVIYFIIK